MKFKENLISIIMPAYQSENTIRETIQSVINQTYTNWELIVVDDCSTDETMSILKELSTLDERITAKQLKKNSGAAVARNTAIHLSSGRFISFLDSDDQWLPEKLETQVDYMKKNDSAFSFMSFYISNNGERKLVEVPSKLSASQLLKNTIIGTLTVMIDRKQVEVVEMPNVRRGQDLLTWYNILKMGVIAEGINQPLSVYIKGDDSLSSNKIVALKRTWYNYRKMLKLPIYKATYYFAFYCANAIKKYYF